MSNARRRAPLRLLPILASLAAAAACQADYGPPRTPASIDLYPAVSPDGEWLLYSRYGAELAPGLYRVRIGAAEAEPELLIPDEAIADWSPDGKVLALQIGLQAYRYDFATGALTALTEVGANTTPTWSPDGRTLAFASNNDDNHRPPDLWLMRPDGSAKRRVPLPDEPRGEMSDMDWSPAGDRLVTPGYPGLFLTDTLGKDTLYLPTETGVEASPVWSPTGEWIAYHGGEGYGDVWLIRPDGRDKHRLVREAAFPSWFPDGKQLAVARPGETTQTIWAVDLDGNVLRELTRGAE
jgi:TolB protein